MALGHYPIEKATMQFLKNMPHTPRLAALEAVSPEMHRLFVTVRTSPAATKKVNIETVESLFELIDDPATLDAIDSQDPREAVYVAAKNRKRAIREEQQERVPAPTAEEITAKTLDGPFKVVIDQISPYNTEHLVTSMFLAWFDDLDCEQQRLVLRKMLSDRNPALTKGLVERVEDGRTAPGTTPWDMQVARMVLRHGSGPVGATVASGIGTHDSREINQLVKSRGITRAARHVFMTLGRFDLVIAGDPSADIDEILNVMVTTTPPDNWLKTLCSIPDGDVDHAVMLTLPLMLTQLSKNAWGQGSYAVRELFSRSRNKETKLLLTQTAGLNDLQQFVSNNDVWDVTDAEMVAASLNIEPRVTSAPELLRLLSSKGFETPLTRALASAMLHSCHGLTAAGLPDGWTSELFAQTAAARLGDRLPAWSLLFSMMKEFSGTYDELLDTVEALTPTE